MNRKYLLLNAYFLSAQSYHVHNQGSQLHQSVSWYETWVLTISGDNLLYSLCRSYETVCWPAERKLLRKPVDGKRGRFLLQNFAAGSQVHTNLTCLLHGNCYLAARVDSKPLAESIGLCA